MISRQGDRRIEARREEERHLHYATQALLAAALAFQAVGDGRSLFDLYRAVAAYRAAEAALLKAEAT
jgi:hypothetical protein